MRVTEEAGAMKNDPSCVTKQIATNQVLRNRVANVNRFKRTQLPSKGQPGAAAAILLATMPALYFSR